MFFNRTKQQEQAPAAPIGLTDGIEGKVAAFVKDWGAIKRGQREFIADSAEPPLQLLTDADVAYFADAMNTEIALLEDEVRQIKEKTRAAIAQKDAEIAAINREIEAQKARNQAEFDEINRRALARAALIEAAAKIDPSLDASNILKDADIRRDVVRRKFGDVAVDGRSEAYVDERFESLEAHAKVDPFARVVADGLAPTKLEGRAAAEKAYQDQCDYLRNAHKTRH
ncbi:hypothetical protein GOZ90_09675 [Agrobacterium vitis]|uniref:Phage protein n=1 Tax=Agrobacterium vitis TaxID=373 RepID=A0A6L6VDJ1_AGRVI|nr:hypothetical protein [Agrobacterium vitis]MUZ72951.1 hypothetical protein [Agrobacterium vitis]